MNVLEILSLAAIILVLSVCALAPFIMTKGETDDLR